MELMSNHAERWPGCPRGRRRRRRRTPRRRAADAGAAGRARRGGEGGAATGATSATEATFKPVRKKIEDAGIDLRLLCYNMNVRRTDRTGRRDRVRVHDGEGARRRGDLDVDAGQHGEASRAVRRQAQDDGRLPRPREHHGPDEVATPESFDAVMAASKYHGANLDIGHYTEAGYDPVAFIQKHHARITNLHLKDKKKASNGGGNGPWGRATRRSRKS